MKNVLRLATVASLVSASVLGGIAMRSADAAPITWGAATTISGTTDVNTVGTLYAASSFGSAPVTVNGVTFAAWSPVPSGTAGVSSGDFTLFQTNTGFAIYPLFGSGASPFSGLAADYQSLLGEGIYGLGGGGSSTVTVSGLTIGQEYSIQFWANDSRAAISATQTVDGNTLDVNTTNADGGVGQWISGTFTADGTSQNFNVSSGSNNYYSAIQVRAVPEPSSLAGLGVVGAGLAAVIRRRLRAAKSAS